MKAEKEKAILDLLYLFNFYKTEEDLTEFRFNESALKKDEDLAVKISQTMLLNL